MMRFGQKNPEWRSYPPDLQAEATKLVLEQAEVLCADWAA